MSTLLFGGFRGGRLPVAAPGLRSRWRPLGAVLAATLLMPLPARAIDYLNVTVQPDRAIPAVCLSFSSPLPRGRAEALAPFVALTPAGDHSLEAHGKDLCIGGLAHGQSYEVRVKAGLPGADGTTLAKDATVPVAVPDRDPQVSFDKGKTLLPLVAGVGLPLKSVNVGKAHLALYRFTDRALVSRLSEDWFGQAIASYALDQIADRATKLFEGSLAIATVRNRQVSTTIPIADLVKTLQPGVYVAVATSEAQKGDRDTEKATQWFSVSDIGLTTVKTDAGMLVAAHSLQSAAPLPGLEVKLVSRADEVLATSRTDADGRVLLAGGLLRGGHGDAAKIVTAQDERGSFTWLQLDTPSLDLSDLDIKGRTPPGANDAFLWTDRGVYRPGETIHLGGLLRDRDARATGGAALTIHIVRPDGIEVDKKPLALAAAAGGALDVPLADNAFSGTWRLWASVGDATNVGEVSVSVQDFVPPRLDAKVTVPAGALAADGPIPVEVAADYFYGSPGAELSGTVEGTLRPAEAPFAGLDGFRFGLVEDPFLPKALQAGEFTTDDKGKAHVELKADDVPDTTAPLAVTIRASVNDVDGRPAVAETTKVLHTADRFIGVRAAFASLAGGDTARFEVALVDGDGHPLGRQGVKWDLVKEDYAYTYFYRDGRWQSHETITDARVNGGEVGLDASGRGAIQAPVTDGRWRLEVYDPAGKTATSLRFGAGWWATSEGDENRKPEVMPVAIDANPPAGKVRAMIEPSFAGRVLVMLDGNGLHGVRELAMPKGGGAVEFDAADVPAAGAYVLAVAVSPAGTVIPRLPVRAVGLAWVPGAAAARTLDVALAAPETIRPQTTLAVDVSVKGVAPGGEAFVALAAVDEAVLRMTAFATPDPADHYLGRREPGFELRDVYNQLIDPAGTPGQLKEGGDGNANLNLGNLDVKTFKTVALFKGPVKLDADGHARIGIDVPDFSGRLRLMAVAWTADRFGKADRSVTVRPPLLAELTLPRFLAPGDKVRARVMLTDLDAPEQTYTVALTTVGAVAVDRPDALFKDMTRDKRRFVDRWLTAAAVPGVGRIHMTATGADGARTERDFEISVRTPNAYVTNRQIVEVAPGGRLAYGDALGADLVPGTGKLEVTVSSAPAFDTAGLLADLRRYPYGCAEQTISRAFPELFVRQLGGPAVAPVADAVTGQGAIQRLASLQADDGSFGYWTSFDTGNFWLTAYAVDFLQHARGAGLSVPDAMEARATTWLAGKFASAALEPRDVAGAAYAAIVLSRAGKLDLSQLRYVASQVRHAVPSNIARVQLASALSRVGERDMAGAFLTAPVVNRDPRVWLNDYGSPVRDEAMTLSLLAEEKLLPRKALFERALGLSRATAGKTYLSTQEEVWLLRVAADLSATSPLDVAIDGRRNAPGETATHATLPLGAGKGGALANNGREPVYAALGTTGIPAGRQPAESNGFSVARDYFHLDGSPANLADLHQNDELVIVLTGSMADSFQRKVLAVDMLPAGLEPETVGLATSRDDGQFKWLKDLTEPTFFALRDDRYVAGIELGETTRAFKFAYVVRAVSTGSFTNPGPQVEDMYAPAFHARGAAGTLEVKPARPPAAKP